MKKTEFDHSLRNWMATPNEYDILLVKAKDAPLCIVVTKKLSKKKLVEAFYINTKAIKPALQGTLVKRIAFKLLDEARKDDVKLIEISKGGLTTDTVEQVIECGYVDHTTSLLRVVDSRVVDISEIRPIPQLEVESPLQTAINRYIQQLKLGTPSYELAFNLEKAMWPLKISGSNIPCYIIPIKADYAIQLFDEKLAHEHLSLFANDKTEPALSVENVYFKSCRHSVPAGRARILWYVSQSDYMGTGMVRACSYLDKVEKGKKKDLYKKYRRLGVLTWEELMEIGGESDTISAYVFSYTELFDKPVHLDDVRKYINNKSASFQSFKKIDEDAYIKIYKAGRNADNHD